MALSPPAQPGLQAVDSDRGHQGADRLHQRRGGQAEVGAGSAGGVCGREAKGGGELWVRALPMARSPGPVSGAGCPLAA